MNKKLLILRIQQITWIAALVIFALLVLSAVGKRQKTHSMLDMNVDIQTDAKVDSNLITEEEINEILQTSFDRGVIDNEIRSIDVKRAERVLEKNPFIKNADVYIDNQHRINVKVTQREPVVRIIDGDGRNYYLDKDGNYMPLSEHYTARVLTLTGFIKPHEPNFMSENSRHMLKNLFELTNKLRSDSVYHHLIEQVYVQQNGDIILVPKMGKQKILFGKYLNVEEKLQRLKIFYHEALPQEGWAKYHLIDIRLKDQIVCRK